MVEEREKTPGDEGAQLASLVADVMRIERRFGHELRANQSERREAIRDAIEKLVKVAG